MTRRTTEIVLLIAFALMCACGARLSPGETPQYARVEFICGNGQGHCALEEYAYIRYRGGQIVGVEVGSLHGAVEAVVSVPFKSGMFVNVATNYSKDTHLVLSLGPDANLGERMSR